MGTLSSTTIPVATLIQDMLAGKTYVIVRDTVFPSGEIRGQIGLVPEPASAGMLGGLACLVLFRRPKAW